MGTGPPPKEFAGRQNLSSMSSINIGQCLNGVCYLPHPVSDPCHCSASYVKLDPNNNAAYGLYYYIFILVVLRIAAV